jgi:hypothetical protein
MLKLYNVRMWTGFKWLMRWSNSWLREHYDESVGSVKGVELVAR